MDNGDGNVQSETLAANILTSASKAVQANAYSWASPKTAAAREKHALACKNSPFFWLMLPDFNKAFPTCSLFWVCALLNGNKWCRFFIIWEAEAMNITHRKWVSLLVDLSLNKVFRTAVQKEMSGHGSAMWRNLLAASVSYNCLVQFLNCETSRKSSILRHCVTILWCSFPGAYR